MRLIEACVGAMATVLIEQLPAKIDALNLEYTDGTIIPQVQAFVGYDPDVSVRSERPLVAVLAGPTRFLADTGFGQGGWADAQHQLGVAYFLDGGDQRVLSRQALRMQRALMEVIGANRVGVLDSTGVAAWSGLSIQGTTPGSLFDAASSTNVYTEMGIITCLVTRTEA